MTIELIVVFPIMLAAITAMLQFGLWFHARSLALVAAQEGVTAARTYTAQPAAGPVAAQGFLDAHAGDSLTTTTITLSTPAPGQVAVTVTGHALSILPGIPGPAVTQSAEGPIERFTTAGAP